VDPFDTVPAPALLPGFRDPADLSALRAKVLRHLARGPASGKELARALEGYNHPSRSLASVLHVLEDDGTVERLHPPHGFRLNRHARGSRMPPADAGAG
jgi:hypothetical protein